MNDFSNELSATQEGFSAPSVEELDQVEGGLYRDFTSMKVFESVANWCQELARNTRG